LFTGHVLQSGEVLPILRSVSTKTCECWIYRPGDGLRHATLDGAETELTLDGERLRSWCILDRSAVVVIYSAQLPTREVRRTAARLSREWIDRESLATS
jgi:hypothetical protein